MPPEPSDAPQALGVSATEGAAAISVAGLRMSYAGREVLHGIDLEVGSGEVFGFLGPNGAGKTTTVAILEGMRARTGGQVSVLGEDPGRAGRVWRARIGVVLQTSGPERGLSVAECVSLYAGYYPHPRPVEEVLALVGLSGAAGQRASRLSGGQLRRLDVALALVGRPELLFLDEPTTGFDPAARRQAWEMIKGLRAGGVTIFLTTHYLEEAEALADRVAVIVAGRIVASGTPATVKQQAGMASRISFSVPAGVALPAGLSALAIPGADGRVEVVTTAPAATLASLTGWAQEAGCALTDLEVRRPSLEDVYLALTAEGGR